jgi:hypothetical protein
MKKTFLSGLFLAVIVLAGCSSSSTVFTGQSQFDEAMTAELDGAYMRANRLYQEALPLLREEGDLAFLAECRLAVKRTGIIISDYSATEGMIRSTLSERFAMGEDQMNSLLSRVDYLDMEGTRYYFEDFFNTVYNLDISLMQQLEEELARNRLGYTLLQPFVNTPGPDSGTPYINPIDYHATAIYNIPRDKLPLTGLLKIWQPVPIRTDCQTEVVMVSVSPESYVKSPASLDGNLGSIYMEVPLEGLSGNVEIEIVFHFRHFEQRFTMIDPDNVGAYDPNSASYQEFTASGRNIFISPEIEAKAIEVVGGEGNPYRAARRIYDYIVEEMSYSHLPHGSLGYLDIPESVYVHNHQYGDCGAQSIYFAALCRSVGIPARATGGYQLFPGMEGSHFWAEFYLPNYGWVPVDTSVAQISKYLPELTDDQRRAFKDYFFGSMDPYRWVIQKNVDYPFSPPAPEPTVFSMALQYPAVLCDEMDGIPEEIVWSHYRIQFSTVP